MRSILQLCALLLLVLSGQVHIWGNVDVAENIAVRGFEGILVDCTDPDAPPTLLALGEPGPCGYDFASDVRNGPNLYAYVKQNPWTMWDPRGLSPEEMLVGNDAVRMEKTSNRGDGSVQQAASTIADVVPFLGTGKGIYEIARGKDPVTGNEISGTQKVVAGVATLAGIVPFGKVITKSIGKAIFRNADEVVETVVKQADNVGGSSARVTAAKADEFVESIKAVDGKFELPRGDTRIGIMKDGQIVSHLEDALKGHSDVAKPLGLLTDQGEAVEGVTGFIVSRAKSDGKVVVSGSGLTGEVSEKSAEMVRQAIREE